MYEGMEETMRHIERNAMFGIGTRTVEKKEFEWLIEIAKFKNHLIEQNKVLEAALSDVRSEINYALYSNKSREVKDHYLENAIRYIDRALEVEE